MDLQQTKLGVRKVVGASPLQSNIRRMIETETEILEGEGPAPATVYQHIAVRNGLKVLEGLRGKDKVLMDDRQAGMADKYQLVDLPDNRATVPGVVGRQRILREEEETTKNGRP